MSIQYLGRSDHALFSHDSDTEQTCFDVKTDLKVLSLINVFYLFGTISILPYFTWRCE